MDEVVTQPPGRSGSLEKFMAMGMLPEMDLESEEVDADERLDCAAMGACPSCDRKLPENDGLVFWPEGLS